jgi:hypothetical protein
MKNRLLIVILFIYNITSAQMENFTLNNHQVTWNKVFETSKTIEIIKAEIESRNNLKITSVTENSILGEFTNILMDYKKAGFSYMGTPIILNETNKFSGTFKIEFRENRYRAGIWNLNSKGMDMSLYSGGFGIGSELTTSLEELLLKNNREEFRKNFYKVNGKIIDITFINLMDFTRETKENEKW